MSFGSEFATGFAQGFQMMSAARDKRLDREQRQQEFEWKKQYYAENQRINREVHHVLSPEDAEKERKLKEALPGGGGAQTSAAGGGSGSFMDTLAQVESGNRNVPSGVDPDVAGPGTKSQGFFQINTPTWRDFAGRAGVSLSQYPNAMSAPREVQARVASVIPFARFGPRTQKMMRAKFGDFSSRETVGALAARFGGSTLPSAASTKIASPALPAATSPTQAQARPAYIAPGDTTDTQAGAGDLDAIIANPTTAPETKAWAERERARLYRQQQAEATPQSDDEEDTDPEEMLAAQGGAIPARYEPGGRVSGNIDVREQPQVPYQGKTATVQSMSFGEDGREVLIPRVSQRQQRVLDPKDAIDEYHQTGRHLGQFPTPDEADEYAQGLHQREEERTMKPAIPPRQSAKKAVRKFAAGGTTDYFAVGQSGNPFPSLGGGAAGAAGGGWRPRQIGEAPADFGPKPAPAPALQGPKPPVKSKKPTGTSLMQGPGKGPFSWSPDSRFEEKIPTVEGWGADALKNIPEGQLQQYMMQSATVPNDPRGMQAWGGGPASWAFGVGTRMTPEQSQQMQDYARYRLGEFGVHNATSMADLDRAQAAANTAVRVQAGHMGMDDRTNARAKGGPINKKMGIPPRRRGTQQPPMGVGNSRSTQRFAEGGAAKDKKAVNKLTGQVAAKFDPEDYEAPELQPNIAKGGKAYGGPYVIPRQEDIGWGVDMVTPAQARTRERRAELEAFRADQPPEEDPGLGIDPRMFLSPMMGGMGGGAGLQGGMGGMGMPMMGLQGSREPPGAGSPTGYRQFAGGGPLDPFGLQPGDADEPFVGRPQTSAEWGPQGPDIARQLRSTAQRQGPQRQYAAGGPTDPADPLYGTTTGVMQAPNPEYNEPQTPWRPNQIGDVPQEYGPHPAPAPSFKPKVEKPPQESSGLAYAGELQSNISATGGAYGLPSSSYGGGPAYGDKAGGYFYDQEGKYAVPAEHLRLGGQGLHARGGMIRRYAPGGPVIPEGSFGGGIGGGATGFAGKFDWRNYWKQPPEYFRAGPGGSEAQHGEIEQMNARYRGPGQATPQAKPQRPSQGTDPNAGDPGLRRPYDTKGGIPEGPQVGQNLPEERADKKLPPDTSATDDPNALTPAFTPASTDTPPSPAPAPAVPTPRPAPKESRTKDDTVTAEPAIPPRTTKTKGGATVFERTTSKKPKAATDDKIEFNTPDIKLEPGTYAQPDEAGVFDPQTAGKPLPPLKPGEKWEDLGDGTFRLQKKDVGATGSLGEARGITVGGPLQLQRAVDDPNQDPDDPNGFFQLRRAEGLAQGGAIPSRYAPGGAVNDNAAAAAQRLRERQAAAVGLTRGDLARAQSDPSRYGPYFFDGAGGGAGTAAPRGKPVTPAIPGRTGVPTKPRSPTGAAPGGIPEGPQVGQEVHDEGQRYYPYPRQELSAVPLDDSQNLRPVPPLDSERIPEAPRSYVQQPNEPLPRPLHEAYQPIIDAPRPSPDQARSPGPDTLSPSPPPRAQPSPPGVANTQPRPGISSPGFFPPPRGPVPPRVDPQRSERPPRQVRQIDPRLQPAMGWVYVLGPNGQPMQVPRNAAHLYPPLPPPGPDDQLPARPATAHPGVLGGQPRRAPVTSQQPFPERAGRRPPVPAVAQGGMIPHYAPGGPLMTEQDQALQQSDPTRYGAPMPQPAIPSRAMAAAPPFGGPAPASQPAAGAAPAQAQQQTPKLPPEQQDQIVNPNREANPALPSFVNGLQWFEKKLQGLIDGSASDPRAQVMLQDIAHGDGAPQIGVEVMTQEEVKQVEHAVDPEQKLDVSQRNIKAYQDIYDFYLAHDQPEKAAATAMALTNYNKRFTQTAGLMSQAALEAGNTDAAIQWLDKAYERVPNYRDLVYSKNPDGTYNFQEVDRLNNKVLNSGTAGPQEIMALAKQFQTGGFFDQKMAENMKEVAMWRGRHYPEKAERPPNEAALKREGNRAVTDAYEMGVAAGAKGDRAGIMEAARVIYDNMGRTEESMKTVDRMFRDAQMEPPASIQQERDLHPVKDPNDPSTLKERDRVAQQKTREKLQTDIAASRDDDAKNKAAYRAYADQNYQWQPENTRVSMNDLVQAVPSDLKEDDPNYSNIRTGAFMILKRNDIDPHYAFQFMRALLDPTKPYRVTQDGNVEIAGMNYPMFLTAKVLQDAERWRQGAVPKKAA